MTLYHRLAQSVALVHRLTTLATHLVRHIAIYRTGKHKCPDIATLRKTVAILQDDGIRGVGVDGLGIGICHIEDNVANNGVGECYLQAGNIVAKDVATLRNGNLHGVHLVAHHGVKRCSRRR